MFSPADLFEDARVPDTAMVEIRDWRAYPLAVEAGHAAMRQSLAALDRPIGELRRSARR